MKVLIVESESGLAKIWQNHLERLGMTVERCRGQTDAIDYLFDNPTDIIILDLMLRDGSALAVADYASYKLPETRVIFVTSSSFFSDGSIFSFACNACAFVKRSTPVDDLAAIVEHYGGEAEPTPAPEPVPAPIQS